MKCGTSVSRLGFRYIIVISLFVSDNVMPLQLLEIRVPPRVSIGSLAPLSCRWQLDGDVLYSVKWYKDSKEFFRHVPRDVQLYRMFELPGVVVKEYDPTGSNLTLGPVTVETSGRYRCEVSGEKPVFRTVSKYADLLVIDGVSPHQRPTSEGFRDQYTIGERVQVKCTSSRSQPETRLAWYINGDLAPPSALRPPTYHSDNGLQVTSLDLDFELTPKNMKWGRITIKCLAVYGSIRLWSTEEWAVIRSDTSHAFLSYATEDFTEAFQQNNGIISYQTPIFYLMFYIFYILTPVF